MVAEIDLLIGPAGRGKTARLLARYRQYLCEAAARLEIGGGLWLTPTEQSAAFIRQQLLDDDLTACFNPQVLTFSRFADRVLRDSPVAAAPLSPMLQRVLLRQITEGLASEGKLTYFQPIAETGGFLSQVMSFVSELKRAEIWPERLEEVLDSGDSSSRDRELSAIYRQYQDYLLRQDLYDGEGRFWSARDQLSRGHWGAFGQLSFVIVDGFSDFTHTQYEILQLLAEKTETMTVSLPLETPLRRSDLFAKPQAAMRRLSGSSTQPKEPQRQTVFKQAALAYVAEHLFENPREITPSESAEGIQLIEATGQQGEARAIAAEIKSLLAGGCSPVDIVVTFRSLTDYADLIRETFQAAGIPYSCRAPISLSNCAVIKALRAILDLAQEDWPYNRLLGLLRNNYIRPVWPEIQAEEAADTVLAQLRRFQLRGGQREIIRRLERAAEPWESAEDLSPKYREKMEAQRQAAGVASDFLNRLASTLQPLQKKQMWREWADTLVGIGRELGLTLAPAEEPKSLREAQLRQRDVRAWTVFEQTLYATVEFQERLSGGDKPIEFARMLEDLTDLIQQTSITDEDPISGRVRVFDADQVRNLDVPYLFVGGLTETGFPLRQGEDCFFSEADRRQFNERGLPLEHRTSRTQDEMLLFYGVVTRARQRLILSYPAMNLSGQPLLPSPYLLALKKLFGEEAIPLTRCTELDPVPSISGMLTETDFRIAAMDQALKKDAAPLRSFFETPGHEPVVRSLLAATDMAEARFKTHGFTPYEGLIDNQQLKRDLERRYSPDHQFSATELDAYAACPFKYFASHLLNVNPLETPELQTEYLRRGLLVHDILKRLHREYIDLLDSTESEDPTADHAALIARFEELLAQELSSHPHDPQLTQVLDEIETRLLNEWGTEYAKQWDAYREHCRKTLGGPPTAMLYEAGFGSAPGDDAPGESPANADCLELGVAHRKVKVRGRIDRIDVGEIAGQKVFSVIDYKTGGSSRYKKKDLKAGNLIQLPLYAMAAERLGLVEEGAIPAELIYWFVKEKGFDSYLSTLDTSADELTSDDVWLELQNYLETHIPEMAARIRRGEFPVYNPDKDCTKHCEYKMTCRVGQIRALEETLHKTWTITPVTDEPTDS